MPYSAYELLKTLIGSVKSQKTLVFRPEYHSRGLKCADFGLTEDDVELSKEQEARETLDGIFNDYASAFSRSGDERIRSSLKDFAEGRSQAISIVKRDGKLSAAFGPMDATEAQTALEEFIAAIGFSTTAILRITEPRTPR